MRRNDNIFFIAGGAILLLILRNLSTWKPILSSFLIKWEKFSAKPYWDFKQWSWGYGTRVPGSVNSPSNNPGGTITQSAAITAMIEHVNNDYIYLKGLIKIPLKNNQWAALLSFSYNLGPGNADNLVTNINSGNFPALETQWKAYHFAGDPPEPKTYLIDRRNAEWHLFVE